MQINAHSTKKILLNYICKDRWHYAQQIAEIYTLRSQREKKETNPKVIETNNKEYLAQKFKIEN